MATALDLMLDSLIASLDPGAARSILDFRLDPNVEDRMTELAEKCNEGNLTDEEQAEYVAFVEGVDLIAILKARAGFAVRRDRRTLPSEGDDYFT